MSKTHHTNIIKEYILSQIVCVNYDMANPCMIWLAILKRKSDPAIFIMADILIK